MIPFHKPLFGREEEMAVADVLRSGWVAKGPVTEKFELLLSEYIGSKYLVGLNSCTAGLHLSLLALGIGPGDEVIVPAVTFAATANVVVHCGAEPVFADIGYDGNISTAGLQSRITKRTRAVIVVHLAGKPVELAEIKSICKKYGLFLIEDCAHALGASYKGKHVGLWGDAAAFSFYATKNITMGEGGAVILKNKKNFEFVKKASLHGLSADAWKRYMPLKRVYYTVDYPGYKYNMFDIIAAIGIEQLKKYKFFLSERERLWGRYDKNLSGIDEIVLPDAYVKSGYHARHLYIVRTNSGKRGKLTEFLLKFGINTQLHFKSLHLHPYYRKRLGLKPSDYPGALDYTETAISLPLYPGLKMAEIDYICDKIKSGLKKI